jgi:transposase InsO family protein
LVARTSFGPHQPLRARPFTDTADRIALLPQFLDFYNRRRPHWSLNGEPPMSRVPVNDLTGKNN